MCGIAGVVPREGVVRPEIVRGMLAFIAHRGPDAAGLYRDKRACIGSRRLSIIDLATGDQPIANESDDVWTVYNGEIYNFQDLRADLSARGHLFKTLSDTEVIVHAYEEDGDKFVGRLKGMFAIALWDVRRHRLLLARDRLGKKPLYFGELGSDFVFASELQAFAAHPDWRPRAEPRAIESFLTFGVVSTNESAVVGISRVPAGAVLAVDEGRIAIRPYWSPSYRPTKEISFEMAVASFREYLDRAVRRRLVADVPLGAFLSGGLDSSSVVALMARASAVPVRTFSVGFREAGYSELVYARAVAKRYRTEHTEVEVDARVADVLPMLIEHFGEPFADASALPTYYISRVAAGRVKVALGGDGGDELLGGYRSHHVAELTERLHRSPVGRGARIGASLPRQLQGTRAARFLHTIARPLPARYLAWRSAFNSTERRSLFTPDFSAAVRSDEEIDLPPPLLDESLTPVERVMGADLEHYLVFDLMPKADIASMACSLEVRSPFLDEDLMDFIARLPADYRVKSGRGKRLLREAIRDLLPPEVAGRGKHGFDVPIANWLAGELRPLVEDCVLGDRPRARGLIRPEAALGVERRFRQGHPWAARQLWTLLILELWARAFIDGEHHDPAPSTRLVEDRVFEVVGSA